MSLPIPYGMDYTSTASGAVLKRVVCEHCQAEYAYTLERSAIGEGTSLLFIDNEGAAQRASSRAEQELQRKLERGIDVVPCPACGWIQKNMIPRVRREYRRWMLYAAGLLIFIPLLVAFIGGVANEGGYDEGPHIPWPIFLGTLGALVFLGLGLLVVRFVTIRRYDPNSQDAETRKRIGQGRALLREQWEQLVKAEQEKEMSRPQEGIAQEMKTDSPQPSTIRAGEPLEMRHVAAAVKSAAIVYPGSCPACGVVNPTDARACACCGHDLPKPKAEAVPWWQFWR
jgi:hypothetical protein